MWKHALPFGLVVAALVAGGCVTKSAYEKLESEKNQEIATLQKQSTELAHQIETLETQRTALDLQKAQLERESVALQTQVGLLQQQRAALEQQKGALEAQHSQLQQQVQALEQQKAQLMSASRQTQAQYDSLVRNLKDEVQKGQLQVRQYKDMLTVDVAEQLFFDSGQASLKDSGKQVLKKVAEALKSYDEKAIRVIGHTDNVPIAKPLQKVFPSNWELSVARATTVVRYLQELGIPPERLIASGRAEYSPVAGNNTPEGRKKNRRIEITLIDRSLAPETMQATKAAGAATGAN